MTDEIFSSEGARERQSVRPASSLRAPFDSEPDPRVGVYFLANTTLSQKFATWSNNSSPGYPIALKFQRHLAPGSSSIVPKFQPAAPNRGRFPAFDVELLSVPRRWREQFTPSGSRKESMTFELVLRSETNRILMKMRRLAN